MTDKIQIITNYLGDGDWVIVTKNNEIIYEGHSIDNSDFYEILKLLGINAIYIEIENFNDFELVSLEND